MHHFHLRVTHGQKTRNLGTGRHPRTLRSADVQLVTSTMSSQSAELPEEPSMSEKDRDLF